MRIFMRCKVWLRQVFLSRRSGSGKTWQGARIGYDPWLHTGEWVKQATEQLAAKGADSAEIAKQAYGDSLPADIDAGLDAKAMHVVHEMLHGSVAAALAAWAIQLAGPTRAPRHLLECARGVGGAIVHEWATDGLITRLTIPLTNLAR